MINTSKTVKNYILDFQSFCSPADSHAKGTTSQTVQQTTHQVNTVGWRERRQETHGQVRQQGEDRISWRVGHLRTNREQLSYHEMYLESHFRRM